MDIQFVNEALRKYVVHKDRNIDQIYNYAKQFRIQKIVKDISKYFYRNHETDIKTVELRVI